MVPGLIGTKVGMTRVIGERGAMEPVTVVKAGPCVVLQVKSMKEDGYTAVQLGFDDVKPHRSTMAMIGHAAKAQTGPKRHVREFRLPAEADLSCGEVLTVEGFAEGVEYVDVTGTTIGKGFAGVMKRHGFGGMEASHGVERKHRSGGSVGGHASGNTGRGIKKGKKMPGHMGDVRRTATSLKLIAADIENDLLLIRGSIPGPNGSVVVVKKAKKK